MRFCTVLTPPLFCFKMQRLACFVTTVPSGVTTAMPVKIGIPIKRLHNGDVEIFEIFRVEFDPVLDPATVLVGSQPYQVYCTLSCIKPQFFTQDTNFPLNIADYSEQVNWPNASVSQSTGNCDWAWLHKGPKCIRTGAAGAGFLCALPEVFLYTYWNPAAITFHVTCAIWGRPKVVSYQKYVALMDEQTAADLQD